MPLAVDWNLWDKANFYSQGYNSHRLFLDNLLWLFIPLKVIYGLFPFVDLICTSYFTHLHP